MKISIIIPVYNVKDYLDLCLESLINQTVKQFEVILVDDGSTDESGKICDKYAKKYSYIRVIHKENGGLSSARNEGLKNAKFDYVMFIDSDDYVSTTLCEKVIKIIEEYKPDLVQYDFGKFDDGNLYQVVNNDKKNIRFITDNSKIMDFYYIKQIVFRETWTKVYRKELFDDIKFPVGRIAEDLATTYLILNKINSIAIIDENLYYYRVRSNSIMGSGSIKLFYDAMLGHYEIYNFTKDNKKYSKKTYTNYFNNLMKLYAKNEIECHNYNTKDIKKRYAQIKVNLLTLKGKLVYYFSKINLKFSLNLIYKKFVINRK